MGQSHKQIIDEIRAKMAEIERGDARDGKTGAEFSIGAGLPASRAETSDPMGSDEVSAGTFCAFGHVEAEAFDADKGKPSRAAGRGNAGRTAKEPAFDQEAAMRKIERLCSLREQASAALRERLVRDGFSEKVAEEAVGRAVECGLVDDARFADVLVRCRLAAGKGCAGIARELASHGIDPAHVESYLDAAEAGSDAELSRALDLLERKPPRAKNAREAAYRRLVGKGFSSSIASSAARTWWESTRNG